MNTFPGTRRQFCALACATFLLPLIGCTRGPEPVLRIGTNVWIGCEPLYLARELGRLDPNAVQLVEYPSASEVHRAYRNQAIDGMVISLDELLGLAADGLQPRIILVVDVSNGADVVVGRRGMRTMRDLKGTLTHVSADLTREQPPAGGQPTQPYYVVRISLAPAEVERLGDFRLVPGMPAEVFIETYARTPLQYFLKPLHEQIARTFRER